MKREAKKETQTGRTVNSGEAGTRNAALCSDISYANFIRGAPKFQRKPLIPPLLVHYDSARVMSIKAPPAMAKTKDSEAVTATKTKTPPATKSKPSKPSKARAKSKPSGLSEDRVVDSDSEEDVAPVKTGPEKKQTQKAESGKVVPDVLPSKVTPASTSENRTSDSAESAPPATKKPRTTSTKVHGVKRKADESTSMEESSEEEGEQELPQSKKSKTSSDVDMKDSSTSDEDDSENESDDSESEQPTQSKVVSESAISSSRSIPALPFVPPEGYTSLQVTNPPSSSILAPGNLSDKQVWHISAPSNVPLKSVEAVAMRALQEGTPILQHRGVDYILAEENTRNTCFQSILLPREGGYILGEMKVGKTFKLQQKIELPNLSRRQADDLTGSSAAADIGLAAVSEIRPQPKGLKMRYKPPGFGPGDPGLGSDSDEEPSAKSSSAFQFPRTLGAHGVGAKMDTEIKDKLDKKRRKLGHVETADLPPSPITKPMKRKKMNIISEVPEVGGAVHVASSQSTETPEERAKRKEAKRLKKEAKRKTEIPMS